MEDRKLTLSAGDLRSCAAALNSIQTMLSSFFKVPYRRLLNMSTLLDIVKHAVSMPSIIGHTNVSHGQYGEDLIVLSLLRAIAPERVASKKIRYLDVGANHPINTSNTWLLYSWGLSGVLVEPNPELHKDIEKARPRDVLLKCGVRGKEGAKGELLVPTHHELASFSQDFIEEWYLTRNRGTPTIQRLDVELVPINDILQEHFSDAPPDFLSLDVESLDYEILATINFDKYAPQIICVEPSDFHFKLGADITNSGRIDNLLREVDYVQIAATDANVVYCQRRALTRR